MIGTLLSAIATRVLTPNVLIGLGILAGVGVVLVCVYFAGYGDGAEAERARYAAQDARAHDVARDAIRDVHACHDAGGDWNVSTGTCR
ncbi:MAG: hypothetical protein ROR55_21150 [Devosia sp.]